MTRFFKHILLLIALCLSIGLSAQCPGPAQRTALINLQRANAEEGTRAGQIPLTDTCGNQRYAQYVEINLSPINYIPTTTGNLLNLSEFVVSSVDTGLYYIDWQGNAIKFGAGGGGGGTCDVDWLEIGPNTCPDHINDSIYTYSYVAVGARYVWPTAEFLVNDSTATAVSVISGSRNARLVFHDNQGSQYSTVDQSGASTLWYIQPSGEWRVLTAASGTPENPLGPFVNQLGINPVDSTVQIYRYPNTRLDTQTVRNFLYTDPAGKIRSQSLDSLIVIIVDSIASDTALQYNWYTRDDTTTDAMRTATILNSARWIGDAVGGSLLLEMGALAGGRLLIDTAATLFNTGLGGNNIVRARPQGVLINTSNTATRAVWLVTDSLNWGGSFSPTRFRINYRSDSTYMFADSFQTVALGRFPSFPASSGGRGLYYAPGTTDGVRLLNRSADGLTRTMVELDPFSSIWETAGSTASVQGSEVAITENAQLNFTTQRNSSTYGSLLHNAITNTNEEVTALTQNGKGINLTASMFLGKGYASSQVYKDTARAWGVESHLSVGSFSWLKTRLPNDTVSNAVSFYNDAYYWKNQKPIGTPGDTLFHYWAENGIDAGKNPGFITLDSIRGSEYGKNWYVVDGTTSDSSRIADVLWNATWRSDDVAFNGNVPFRFELNGGPENEPEMMVWKFPQPTDSLLLGKSDFEIFFRSTNKFLLWSDRDIVLLADSVQISQVENVDSIPYILGQTAPDVVKRFSASDAGNGGILVSSGANWKLDNIYNYVNADAPYIYDSAQTNTTLSVPTWATSVSIICIGGGGGGGSGRKGATMTPRGGGGAGNAGWYSESSFSIQQIGTPSVLYITVGSGGSGGVAQTTNSQNGNAGANGGTSYVSVSNSVADAFVLAAGGTGGNGGAPGFSGTVAQTAGGGIIVGGSGGQGSTVGIPSLAALISGGGGGSGSNGANTIGPGGDSGASSMLIYSSVSGGATDAAGQTPTLKTYTLFGQGGSGAGGSNTAARNGGNGIRGGGGGGGNNGTDTVHDSGAGGNGGAGVVQIIFK